MTGLGDVAAFESHLVKAGMVVPRLAATFFVVPFLTSQSLTVVVRAGVIGMLALLVAPAMHGVAPSDLASWVVMTLKEALIGVMLGIGLSVPIWAMQTVGDLIDMQVGTSNAQVFDPVGGHQGGRTGEFLGWLVIVLFVSSGGLLSLVGLLMESFRVWPAADMTPNLSAIADTFVLRQGDALWMTVVKLSTPVVFVLLLVDVGLGLLGRAAPQLNLFLFTQPIKSALASLMFLLLLFYVHDILRASLDPSDSVLNLLRAAVAAR